MAARKKQPRDPDIHPAAKYFPLLEGQEFRDLCRSIKEHGLQQPILLLDDAILDGQNRLRACRKVGVEPIYKKVNLRDIGCDEDADPAGVIPAIIEFVWRQNADRRHLTPGQRAAIRLEMDTRIEGYRQALERGAKESRREAAARQVRDPGGRYRSSATLHPTGAIGRLTSGPTRKDGAGFGDGLFAGARGADIAGALNEATSVEHFADLTEGAAAPAKTKEILARSAGVSPRTAAKALLVKKKAPDLHHKVIAGQVTLEKAYRAAKDERSVERPEFRRTQYPALAQLMLGLRELGEELPAGGTWVECCAGDGDLIEHVARAGRELGTPVPRNWLAIELECAPALLSLQERASELTTGGWLRAIDGTNFLEYREAARGVYSHRDAQVVITNWPWPGIPPLVDHAFELYPNALVIGLCCVREPLDGGRGDWFRAHAPDYLQCDGRQAFDLATAGYQHPVAWLRWPVGAGRTRREGRWRLLPSLPEEV